MNWLWEWLMRVRSFLTGKSKRAFQPLPVKVVVTSPVSVPPVSQTPTPDSTPTAFTFFDAFGAVAGDTQTSNTITVSGLDSGIFVAATLSGDATSELQIGSGAWQSAAASVQNGDTITVRHTSSALSVSTDTTLTVGGVSDTFTSTRSGTGNAGQASGLLLAITKAA